MFSFSLFYEQQPVCQWLSCLKIRHHRFTFSLLSNKKDIERTVMDVDEYMMEVFFLASDRDTPRKSEFSQRESSHINTSSDPVSHRATRDS